MTNITAWQIAMFIASKTEVPADEQNIRDMAIALGRGLCVVDIPSASQTASLIVADSPVKLAAAANISSVYLCHDLNSQAMLNASDVARQLHSVIKTSGGDIPRKERPANYDPAWIGIPAEITAKGHFRGLTREPLAVTQHQIKRNTVEIEWHDLASLAIGTTLWLRYPDNETTAGICVVKIDQDCWTQRIAHHEDAIDLLDYLLGVRDAGSLPKELDYPDGDPSLPEVRALMWRDEP